MLLQSPVRLPSEPLQSAEPIQLRRDSEDGQREFERVFGTARRSARADQAAVVQFGAQALGLARGQGVAPDAAAPDEAAPVAAGVSPRDAVSDIFGAEPSSGDAAAVQGTVFSADGLSDEERQGIEELKRRDREVRTHEQAHKTAGGAHAGSIRLTYQMGPDGKRYAVAGSVPIDVSPVAGDPAATLRKMEIVHRAANAPANPSSADHSVAAQAQRVTQQARAQLAAERYARARELVQET